MNVRKIFVIVSAAAAVLLSSSHAAYAQTLTFPPEVPYPVGASPEETDDDYAPFSRARIWGWTQNGLVAYSASGMTASAMSYFRFYIFNMVTDEALFTYEDIGYEENDGTFVSNIRYSAIPADANGMTEPVTIVNEDSAQTLMTSKIRSALTHFNIVERQVEFLPFPIRRGGNVFNVKVESVQRTGESYETEITYRLIMDRNGRQSKTVTERTPKRGIYDIQIVGYYMSPFENRALIVYNEVDYGACRDTYHTQVTGAHLGVGFR